MRRLFFVTALSAAAATVLLWLMPRAKEAPANKSAAIPFPAAQARPAITDLTRPALLARLSPETAAFRGWAAAYAEGRGDATLAEGRERAAAHRTRMASLIRNHPRRAMDEALPVVLRQELPPELQGMIEQRVNSRGAYVVLGRAGGGIVREFIAQDGQRYEARVYGRRVRQVTTPDLSVQGVSLDGVLALDENPLRSMDTGERIPPGAGVIRTCAVSGIKTEASTVEEITPESPAVEMGGEVHILCSGGHIRVLSERAIAAEGGTGGPSKPTGSVPGGSTSGVKSLLYIRLCFPDTRVEPQTEREAYDVMKTVNDFFVENSHGKLHLLTTVTPLLVMPKPEDYYKANDNSNADLVLSDGRAVARAAGYDFASYDLDAVRYNGGAGSFNGQAYIGSRGCWLRSSSAGVAAHEFGHNLGVWHANFWNTGGESAAGSGTNAEYGNSFDTMGSASAGNNWFNAGHQQDLQWIPDENVARVQSSGIYRLTQFDQPRIDPASRYLLSITRDSERDYWCEFRQRWSTNRWLTSGVALNWSPWGDESSETTPYGSNGGSQLLDTTPGSPDGKDDSAVVLGRTFSDSGAGIHITPLAKLGTVPESVDVAVHLGNFPGNRAPSLSLTSDKLNVELNEPVNFTAAAGDEHGDALAYAWDWGDRTFGPNSATASRAWSTAGLYTVRCEVSDLRGATRSSHLVVTVGTPAQFTVRGRMLTPEGNPLAGVRIHNGLTGTNYRGTYSDSDGLYTISGLNAGDYSFGAAAATHTLSATLPNPVTVSTDVTAADWTASPRPMVAISLPDDSATEGGDGAVLRFTRIAPNNSGAITVRVYAGGSASLSDADFTPAEAQDQSTWTFTIPSGEGELNVAVTAFNDSSPEGPETLTLFLVDGTGYLPSGPESVSLTIQDNDTLLPVVSVAAPDNSLTEGGDSALLRLSRTGTTGSSLTVQWSRSGTATAGSDYTAPATSVVIPAGFSAVEVPLNALQDTLEEGTENLSFTLSTSGAYLRAPNALSAALTFIDDDIPVISIAATDAAAAELNSDPAVFVISRTGNLSQALSIDYALSGTAQHGTDYLPLPGTTIIPAGQAHAALTVVPLDDSIGESQQSVTVQIRSTSRYVPGILFSATANITDNDTPMISVNVSDGKVDEAGGNGKFKITAQGTGSGNISVRYALSGSATGGTDYPLQTGTLTVPKSGFAELTITPSSDAEVENAESIVLTVLPDAAYSLSLETTATLYIMDGGLPVVNVAAAASSYSENQGPARFYITRAAATADPLTIAYSMAGTATAGQDYTAPSGSITIAANATGVFLDVTLLDDSVSEGAEMLTLFPTADSTYSLLSASASTWLNDNETSGLPTVSFASSASTSPESAGQVNLVVNLSAPRPGEVRVDYALDTGSVFRGADYITAPGTLVFPAGITSQVIPVTIIDDAHIESSETLTVRLLRATAARAGSTTSHTLTIADNDIAPPPLIGFAAPSSTAGEAAGTPPSAIVYLSAAQSVAVSIDWAAGAGTAGADDFVSLNGSLTFTPGETAKTVPLQIIDDLTLEPNETLTLTLSNPSSPAATGPRTSHSLTIHDNDNTSVSLAIADGSLGEQGPDTAQITITRASQNLSSALAVPLTINGSASSADYAPLAEVILPSGEASTTIIISPVDDAEFDPAETIILAPAASALYTITGSPVTLTITDNETGVALTASDVSAAEPDDPGDFLLTRTGPLDEALSVTLTTTGTAMAGADYLALPATAVIPAGQSALTLEVMPVDDTLPEPAELVELAIEPSPGITVTSGSAAVSIGDDDTNIAPQVTILSPSGEPVYLPSGPGLLLRATVTDDGRPALSAVPEVTWELISGDGMVTFENPNSADTAAIFSSPGQYLLRFTATDGELSNFTTLTVFVMSESYTGSNIGTASTATGISSSGGTWTLTGAGTGAGTANTDGCFFAWRKMSGDFTLITRVNSITPAASGASARCGVMIRSATGANVRHAFMSITPTRTSFAYRATDGAAGVTNNTTFANPLPRYVRLRRTGNSFSAAHSTDGITWTAQGNAITITMADPVYAGLAATPASTTATTTVTAEFDNFSLTPAGNVAPFVEAGSELNTPLTALLTGIVTDDTGLAGGGIPAGIGPAILWEKITGPAEVTLPSAAAGPAAFAAAGNYRLRLSADDGSARTFDDLLVTAANPFHAWQAEKFGAESTDPAIRGPKADPDNDGLENLAEYALGTDPLLPGTEALPASTSTDTTLALTWKQSTAASDITVLAEWSTDYAEWSPSGLTTEITGSGEGWLERRAVLDITTLLRAQMRLRVTMP